MSERLRELETLVRDASILIEALRDQQAMTDRALDDRISDWHTQKLSYLLPKAAPLAGEAAAAQEPQHDLTGGDASGPESDARVESARSRHNDGRPVEGGVTHPSQNTSMGEAAAGQGLDLETEQRLRKYLWMSHGHEGMYGDDGEMQCVACRPVWDYKRAPLRDIVRTAIHSRELVNLERLRAPLPTPPSQGQE